MIYCLPSHLHDLLVLFKSICLLCIVNRCSSKVGHVEVLGIRVRAPTHPTWPSVGRSIKDSDMTNFRPKIGRIFWKEYFQSIQGGELAV